MERKNLFSVFIFLMILAIGLIWAGTVYVSSNISQSALIAATAFVLALVISTATRIANPWDKAVVLRLGHFKSLRGRGCFL